ncbi:hypothetical protein ACN3XK_74975 [Actinomadura welshii]
MLGEAREESIRIATAAKREYEASLSRAQSECDRLIENGNISYEKAIQEGIKEQQRLVSQNEVVVSERDPTYQALSAQVEQFHQ